MGASTVIRCDVSSVRLRDAGRRSKTGPHRDGAFYRNGMLGGGIDGSKSAGVGDGECGLAEAVHVNHKTNELDPLASGSSSSFSTLSAWIVKM